jgi:transposase
MKDVTTYVGIDAHKKNLFIAMLMGNEPKPVTWRLANEPHAVRRLVRKLEREAPGLVRVFYEAGPCGYALRRQVTTSRVSCDVVAPALIPRKPGERVKTNRRDARKLAELAASQIDGRRNLGALARTGRTKKTPAARVRTHIQATTMPAAQTLVGNPC